MAELCDGACARPAELAPPERAEGNLGQIRGFDDSRHAAVVGFDCVMMGDGRKARTSRQGERRTR
jgi:hypothetical protein